LFYPVDKRILEYLNKKFKYNCFPTPVAINAKTGELVFDDIYEDP
jgi:hypothetical protein